MLTTCFKKVSCYLSLSVLALGLPAMAQAATYQGHFDEGYIWGSFAGIDRNGDGRITPDELTGFSATLDNMTGGPGQYRVESKSVSNFLFVHHGPGKATLSGTVSFWFRQAVCEYCWGGGYDPYDDAYGFAAMIAPRYSYGEYEVRETLNTSNVSYQLTPATVPLPAGGALLTGGLAALALMRRRGSRPDQQGRG